MFFAYYKNMFRKMSLSGWVLAIFEAGIALKMYFESDAFNLKCIISEESSSGNSGRTRLTSGRNIRRSPAVYLDRNVRRIQPDATRPKVPRSAGCGLAVPVC